MGTTSILVSSLAVLAGLGAPDVAYGGASQPSSGAWPRRLQPAEPESVYMSSAGLREATLALEDAIAGGEIQGAVLLVARHGRIVLHEALGERDGFNASWPDMPSPPMPRDGIFDLESMTKPFTVFLAMRMQESGRFPGFKIDNTVASYFPEFATSPDKARVTIRDLMRYVSGEDMDASGVLGASDRWHTMLTAPLLYTPSQKVLYSDLGFRLLGHVLEKAGGDSLQGLMKTIIFDPLDMSSTSYRPKVYMPAKSERFVGTAWSSVRARYLRGEVQDETDYDVEENTGTPQHGHLTGCDGLFSTALDLAKFGQMLLNRGVHVWGPDALCNPMLLSCPGQRIMSRSSVERMTTLQTGDMGLPTPATTFAQNLFYSGKGLGWETYDPGAWPGGDHTSTVAYSKTGGAGTLMVIDPDPARDLMIILLTNHGLPGYDHLGVDEDQLWYWDDFDAMIEAIRAEEVSDAVNLSLMDVP
ncbi:serine hydrolase domain-containing protein [Sorangium cellulosum]|uniref:serine hydrolase domain-containing protein n=1 Tax=Sorangium cellulosum TaxID=56 RepID=UPI0009B86FFC|nr:serine hydrolase domain-containing protein [Sorangium cellulosum]